MDYKLVHALVITPFEATLPAQSFDELLLEDYPTHLIYNPANGKQILLENSIDSNPLEKISFLQKFIDSTNNRIEFQNIVLVLSDIDEFLKNLQEQSKC